MREEAADAPNAVSRGRGRGSQVKHAQAADLRTPALENQRRDAENQPPIPCKPSRIIKNPPAIEPELGGRVENMPHLGADDARHYRNRHHANGIGIDVDTFEVAVDHQGGADRGQPQHEPKGGNREQIEEMDIRIHRSTQYRRGQAVL